MEALADKPVNNATVEAGKLIISAGQTASTLVVLHKGQVSVRYLSPEEPELLEDSRFFYSLQGPAILGGAGIFGSSNLGAYIISDSECVISVYPTNSSHLLKIFASKPNIAVLLLKTMLKEIQELLRKNQAGNEISRQAYSLFGTMAVAFTRITPQLFRPQENHIVEEMVVKARDLLQEFQDEGGVLLEQITGMGLKSVYSQMGQNFINGDKFNGDKQEQDTDFELVSRLISLAPEVLAAISQRDPAIFSLAGKKLAQKYEKLFSKEASLESTAKSYLLYCLGYENSWADRLTVQCELSLQKMSTVSTSELLEATEFFVEVANDCRKKYFRQWGIEIPQPASWQKLENFILENKKIKTQEEKQTKEKVTITGESLEFHGVSQKIMKWAGFGEDKQRHYQELYQKISQMPSPTETDDDTRKLRRQINNLFWEVYEAALLKYLRNRSELPTIIDLFLNLGFFDERYLDEEHLKFLQQVPPLLRKVHPKYPIHTPVRWFELIYDKKVTTSINDLGMSYVELLRQEDEYRNKPWRKESDLPPELNSGEARVKYELQKVYVTQTKLTSGQLMSFFNPLNRYMLTQSIDHSFVSVDKLAQWLDKLLSIDFSAFHREILYENKELGISREFIQIEVIPNFILTPIAGTQIQFWQDREGNDRYSRGRLLCPIFSAGDLYTMLLTAVARYRWESVKTQMGPDWNNISKSSLTADYTDYVQFLYKNKELSPEMKEKIELEHKRFREDWQRFAHDYILYIKFESEGTQRLNKVVRRILTRHIPFKKEIREKLITSPVFSDLINKSTNIRRNKAKDMWPRLEKYRKTFGKVPQELEYTYRFYNMEF